MSVTQARRKREWAEREAKILAIAREHLVQSGYLGLNMDRIAAELEYSKGTVYNHFSCKEEIVAALAVETMETRVALFQRAASFRGVSRHRMAAVGVATELFVRLYPAHFKFEQALRLDSIWEKTSDERRSLVQTCETRCVEMVAGIVRDGLSRDELVLPTGSSPEDLVFGLWAMTFGAHAIMTSSECLGGLGITSPESVMQRHIEWVLDGYRWRPLSDETDGDALRARILAEVFPDEAKQLEA